MTVLETPIAGLLRVEIASFADERGRFLETWNARRYAAAGIDAAFVQDNISVSRRAVLRGLHYQVAPFEQGKLVSVLAGAVWDVAVDLRPGSATRGRWYGCELSADNGVQLWIPPGFAHGFVVMSDSATFYYKCTAPYERSAERAIRWDDPGLKIAWPVSSPVLSPKDAAAEEWEG